MNASDTATDHCLCITVGKVLAYLNCHTYIPFVVVSNRTAQLYGGGKYWQIWRFDSHSAIILPTSVFLTHKIFYERLV